MAIKYTPVRINYGLGLRPLSFAPIANAATNAARMGARSRTSTAGVQRALQGLYDTNFDAPWQREIHNQVMQDYGLDPKSLASLNLNDARLPMYLQSQVGQAMSDPRLYDVRRSMSAAAALREKVEAGEFGDYQQAAYDALEGYRAGEIRDPADLNPSNYMGIDVLAKFDEYLEEMDVYGPEKFRREETAAGTEIYKYREVDPGKVNDAYNRFLQDPDVKRSFGLNPELGKDVESYMTDVIIPGEGKEEAHDIIPPLDNYSAEQRQYIEEVQLENPDMLFDDVKRVAFERLRRDKRTQVEQIRTGVEGSLDAAGITLSPVIVEEITKVIQKTDGVISSTIVRETLKNITDENGERRYTDAEVEAIHRALYARFGDEEVIPTDGISIQSTESGEARPKEAREPLERTGEPTGDAETADVADAENTEVVGPPAETTADTAEASTQPRVVNIDSLNNEVENLLDFTNAITGSTVEPSSATPDTASDVRVEPASTAPDVAVDRDTPEPMPGGDVAESMGGDVTAPEPEEGAYTRTMRERPPITAAEEPTINAPENRGIEPIPPEPEPEGTFTGGEIPEVTITADAPLETYESPGDPYEYRENNGQWEARMKGETGEWTAVNEQASNILDDRYKGEPEAPVAETEAPGEVTPTEDMVRTDVEPARVGEEDDEDLPPAPDDWYLREPGDEELTPEENVYNFIVSSEQEPTNGKPSSREARTGIYSIYEEPNGKSYGAIQMFSVWGEFLDYLEREGIVDLTEEERARLNNYNKDNEEYILDFIESLADEYGEGGYRDFENEFMWTKFNPAIDDAEQWIGMEELPLKIQTFVADSATHSGVQGAWYISRRAKRYLDAHPELDPTNEDDLLTAYVEARKGYLVAVGKNPDNNVSPEKAQSLIKSRVEKVERKLRAL